MATFDAAPKKREPIISSDLIDINVLRGIEKDMEPYERLCCLFFLIDDYGSGYQTLYNVRNIEDCVSRLVEENRIVDWEDKVLEALCLLQNHQILIKLGTKPGDLRVTFSTDVPEVHHSINKYAKVFYSLFESLRRKKAEELIDRVHRDIPPPDHQNWPKEVSLEIHLLWWIEKGLINISEDGWSLGKLLTILKELNLSDNRVYPTLKKYDVSLQCHVDNRASNIRDVRSTTIGNNSAPKDEGTEDDDEYEINNGLVVIFNQMKFPRHTNYEYREGSEKDCSRIKETFKDTFGFEIKEHKNLEKEEIYSKLKYLRSHGKGYDCVVVFILSHGTCGNIVASDGNECSITKIKSELCSGALQDKPKILIIQACQPQALTTDAPITKQESIGRFEDCLVLSSTIPGELSVRDPLNGTWFIQVLCEVLVQNAGKPVEECLRKVNWRFKNMQANIDGSMIKQLPENTGTLAKKLIFRNRAKVASV